MIEFLDSQPEIDIASLRGRLERAFVARFGLDVGKEVTAEVMTWAWEHRAELHEIDNLPGYLFRVGQSKSRRLLRWGAESVRFPPEVPPSPARTNFEPGLPGALASLGDQQRTAVVMVHCFQFTYAEVAELMDCPLHTVTNLVHRGLKQLRTDLGVTQ